ncbi:MAG: arylamine N-acetyltransferase [Bacteroidota bacterium]
MNHGQYLERIGFQGNLAPSLDLLKKLQRTHLMHVPFENLDIHRGQPIVLDSDKIFEKVVHHRRGGFCYELNGLFFHLLATLGFQLKRVAAQVYVEEKGYGLPFDHLALLVKIDECEYLTDVGFGTFTLGPLKLQLGLEQQDELGKFVIRQHEDGQLRVDQISEGRSVPQYIFTTTAQPFEAFAEMCHYHQHSPDSHFTQKRLISLPNANGRVTLTGNELKIREGEQVHQSTLEDEAAVEAALWQYFRVKLRS